MPMRLVPSEGGAGGFPAGARSSCTRTDYERGAPTPAENWNHGLSATYRGGCTPARKYKTSES